MFSVLSYGSFLTLGAGVVASSVFGYLSSVRRLRKESEERFERFGCASRTHCGSVPSPPSSARRAHRRCTRGRFCELLGLPSRSRSANREFLLERVHPGDRPTLEGKLAELAAGIFERLELEHRLRHEDGSWLWVEVRVVRAAAVDGQVALTGWVTDISERKAAERQLRFHAFRDSLTGLANRSLFMDRLGQCLLRPRPHLEGSEPANQQFKTSSTAVPADRSRPLQAA